MKQNTFKVKKITTFCLRKTYEQKSFNFRTYFIAEWNCELCYWYSDLFLYIVLLISVVYKDRSHIVLLNLSQLTYICER